MSDWRNHTKRAMDAVKSAFGEPVTYMRDGEDDVELQGIIDEAFEAVDPASGTPIISRQPIVGLKIEDLPFTPAKDDQILMRGELFRVIEAQTDGQAGTMLLLHKAAT